MGYNDVDITDMQCWVFRMAQKNGIYPPENVRIFLKNMIF